MTQMGALKADAIDAIVFDFDGVLTDNSVYLDQDGREMVRCSRADGLAFDVLRTLPLKLFLLSTETNPVVLARARKLRVRAVTGQSDKGAALSQLAADEGFALARTLFVGNDLNDLSAIRICGYAACPSDSHPTILANATFRLRAAGGAGVAREIVEGLLGIDICQHIA